MVAFTSSLYADWETISIAAAAISVVGSAMLIMLSRLFDMRTLEQVAKTEFVYAGSTVLIVMMVIGIIGVGEDVLANGSNSVARCMYLSAFQCDCTNAATSNTVFPQNTLVDWMKLYLESPAQCVPSFMNKLYALEVPIGASTSIYAEIFMSEHASGFGFKWIEERILNATTNLSFYTYMYFLLVQILNFIKYYAGFFFSVGVALRAFPPTRGVGAYMMALAFGLYFVFPLSYILIATISLPHAQSEIVIPANSQCQPGPSGSMEYICALPQVSDPAVYQCEGASVTHAFELADRIQENYDTMQSMLDVRIYDFARQLVSTLCIFPLIAVVILMTFVLNTTTLFGGNIPEIGRGLVKLI